MEKILNNHWWTQALIEHRKLDVEEHSGERAHQKRDPDAHELHGSEHELTDWERAWIRARIEERHLSTFEAGDKAVELLRESHDDHEARVLDAKARDYFGDTHVETRRKLEAKRAEHEKGHAEAHLIEHLPEVGGKLQKIPAAAVEEIRAQHRQMIEQLDGYLAPRTGLIDRHIETVTAEVTEARRAALEEVVKAELLLSVPLEDQVELFSAKVLAEIRAHASEPIVTVEEQV